MSLFAWVCRMCGYRAETHDRNPPHCRTCGFSMGRDWQFAFARPLPGHFNHALGAPVTSKQDLDEKWKRKSDEMSERMNFHVQYEAVDPYDLKHSPEAFGVTGEGLDHRAKTLADAGIAPESLWTST